jgi:Domain of unknown function (DUF2017)
MTDRPIARARRGGYVLRVGPDERMLISRLLGELRTILVRTPASGGDPASAAMARLFPVVHPDDAEMEAEYQRLMHDELVASRLSAINAVDELLRGSGRRVTMDDEQLTSFMQAVNAVRLVLGTLLDVSDDDAGDDLHDASGAEMSPVAPERHLYHYLSWLLDSAVAAGSPT